MHVSLISSSVILIMQLYKAMSHYALILIYCDMALFCMELHNQIVLLVSEARLGN